jgi:hypothetical protein
MRETAGRYDVKTEQLAGFPAAATRDDLVGIIYKDRVAEAEFIDALGDLLDLLARMRAGIVWVPPQLAQSCVFDFH